MFFFFFLLFLITSVWSVKTIKKIKPGINIYQKFESVFLSIRWTLIMLFCFIRFEVIENKCKQTEEKC